MRSSPWIIVVFFTILSTSITQVPAAGVEEEDAAELIDPSPEGTNQPNNNTQDYYDYWDEEASVTSKFLDDGSANKDRTSDSVDDEKEIKAATHSTDISEDRKEKELQRLDNLTCGEPPAIDHAKTVGGAKRSPYVLGALVSYSCEFGYIADGAVRSSQCSLSEISQKAEWTNSVLICIPSSCGDPGFVPNAHRIGSLFTFPNSISYECDEGYKLRGSGNRYCQPSGTWSGALPVCEKIACDPPRNPRNGKVRYSSLEFGSELVYECDNGFLLKSYQLRICSENSSWSGDDPLCQEAACEWPIAPEYGSFQVVGDKPSVGSMALYTCEADRHLVGSARSRCLETGEWTFPTPKCLHPCTVPSVPHGKIGKYEIRYRRSKRFKELAAGTKIEYSDELFLLCESKYEPMGRPSVEEKISCKMGQWTEQVRCEPASCWTPPPPTKNAVVRSVNRTNDAGVVYTCNTNFWKAKRGNVKCNFGTWVGTTPVCEDSRCQKGDIKFPGFNKGGKQLYGDQESFVVSCETGFSETKPNNDFTCNKGKWEGHFPPCTPAGCLQDPPSLLHGRIKSFNVQHSSVVDYECDAFFKMDDSNSKVHCNLGNWKGSPPTCKDTRCYAQNLKQKEGLVTDMYNMAYSGEYLQVSCAEGYSSTGVEPFCSEGVWAEPKNPCKESDCAAYKISNGGFTIKTTKSVFNRRRLRYERTTVFEKLRLDEIRSPGSSLSVTCDNGHNFQGVRNSNNILVTCKQGKWKPNPVCLITGTPYEEEMPIASSFVPVVEVLELTGEEVKVAVTEATTVQPIFTTTSVRPPSRTESDGQLHSSANNNNRSVNACSCTYQPHDVNLVAYAGNELLQPGIKVKNNCTVKFHCLHLGYYRLTGPSEIACQNCRDWHSSEYPDCLPPALGDTVLSIEDTIRILPGGSLAVEKGGTLHMRCIPNGVAEYPVWKGPTQKNVRVYAESYQEDGSYIYTTVLKIVNAAQDQSGNYACALNGRRAKIIKVQVMHPLISCAKFEEVGDLVVTYDKGQAMNSSAVFTCRRNRQLVGSRVVTCLQDGRWTAGPPQCVIICSELTPTEDMTISYSDKFNIDSIASFHCFLPSVRSGVAKAKCMSNGEWSDPMPACQMPGCPLDALFKVVPQGVVPDMENVNDSNLPYNFTLKLTCDNNLRLIGAQTAVCGKEAKWEVSNVQCVIGCSSPKQTENSHLILDVDKSFYRIGESVILSCESGEVLTTEVVRVMCLSTGWSPKEIPQCLEE